MGYVNHTATGVGGHRIDGGEHVVAIRGIEPLTWFIQNDKCGVFDQGTRKEYEPLLPFRNIFETCFSALGEAEFF